jgi:hypothetical protein
LQNDNLFNSCFINVKRGSVSICKYFPFSLDYNNQDTALAIV